MKLDLHPDYPQVILGSPCSGHGFKHGPAVGEMMAELLLKGRSPASVWSLERFKNSPQRAQRNTGQIPL